MKTEQAFPAHIFNDISGEIESMPGLTKREYFAAMAMHGLCANSIPGSQHQPDNLAIEALEYADSLLKQLENK